MHEPVLHKESLHGDWGQQVTYSLQSNSFLQWTRSELVPEEQMAINLPLLFSTTGGIFYSSGLQTFLTIRSPIYVQRKMRLWWMENNACL